LKMSTYGITAATAGKKRPTPPGTSNPADTKKKKKKKKAAPTAKDAERHKLPPMQPSYRLEEANVRTEGFPPILYTNVQYNNPCNLQQIVEETGSLTISTDSNTPYGMQACFGGPPNSALYGPTLPPPCLWSQKFAATQAARHGYPSNVLRLLGTISRTVQAAGTAKTRNMKSLNGGGRVSTTHKRYKLTKTQARKQALEDLQYLELETSTEEELETEIQRRIDTSLEIWNGICFSEAGLPQFHDTNTGDLSAALLNDPHYHPLRSLRSWDFVETSTGTGDSDLKRILKSLAEMQCPVSLYKIPLLVAYPRIQKVNDTNDAGDRYQVTIGVYAHRLLPEILVRDDLAVVMAALDNSSYVVSQPLQAPPKPSTPTFQSAEYPKVALDIIDAAQQQEESPTSLAERLDDKTLEGSTQTFQNTISAFSTAGIMKLWENTGCDVRQWPMLHQRLMVEDSKFRHKLLLHQIHALCWMYDMEQLGGFGLNSILWEERKWLDGGTYYWSPALGQLRLDKPPTMHGGILADEMGLGSKYHRLPILDFRFERQPA
jgi:hypothetical protein